MRTARKQKIEPGSPNGCPLDAIDASMRAFIEENGMAAK